jgi:hypothetical protein
MPFFLELGAMSKTKKTVIVAALCVMGWVLLGFEYYAALEREQARCVANLYANHDPINNIALGVCMIHQRTWGPLEYMLVWPAHINRS